MKNEKLTFIANWKLHKTLDEASFWLQEFDESIDPKVLQEKEVVVCPSFVLTPFLRQAVLINPDLRALKLGAQNVSFFEQGPFTGEVSAKQLRGLVDYCIVGHSERRKYFGETDEQVTKKVELCLKYEITPLVCVSEPKQIETMKQFNNETTRPPTRHWRTADGGPVKQWSNGLVVAFEPLFAIGSGQPDTPENAQKMALAIKHILGQNTKVIYGGSVDSKNAGEFLTMPDISGLLIGNGSLEAKEFAKIINSK
ncbi:MAG: triosephosphate isomerase [Candidatus Cloacimonetes bacterium]|nr:triosephosphate isomerase [Candidatus Cloacimonadota bacterium]